MVIKKASFARTGIFILVIGCAALLNVLPAQALDQVERVSTCCHVTCSIEKKPLPPEELWEHTCIGNGINDRELLSCCATFEEACVGRPGAPSFLLGGFPISGFPMGAPISNGRATESLTVVPPGPDRYLDPHFARTRFYKCQKSDGGYIDLMPGENYNDPRSRWRDEPSAE